MTHGVFIFSKRIKTGTSLINNYKKNKISRKKLTKKTYNNNKILIQ